MTKKNENGTGTQRTTVPEKITLSYSLEDAATLLRGMDTLFGCYCLQADEYDINEAEAVELFLASNLRATLSQKLIAALSPDFKLQSTPAD